MTPARYLVKMAGEEIAPERRKADKKEPQQANIEGSAWDKVAGIGYQVDTKRPLREHREGGW